MMTAKELEKLIRNGIPIAAQMAFQVHSLTAENICIVGGGNENINVHGTAFAGSIYAIATLALWGLITTHLPKEASLVLTEGNIRYRQPIEGKIEAHCTISPEEMETFLTQLHRRGRARLEATVMLSGNSGAAANYRGIVFAKMGNT